MGERKECMTIFVGGSKHGTGYRSDVMPDVKPPPSYVDMATGDQYVLAPVNFQTQHPLTGQPDQQWENTIYLHAALTQDPNMGMAALQDAVTRWWFTTHGTHKPLSTPDTNGRAEASPEPQVLGYLALCEGCRSDLAFDTQIERAKWMQEHIDKTGHKPTWSDAVVVTDEGVTDGGQRQRDI
jgi:hypothetical protein